MVQSTAKEQARLKWLEDSGLMDARTIEDFDDIVSLAVKISELPIAYISLIDGTTQWFKSKHGFNLTDSPRAISFCAYALDHEDPFIPEEKTMLNNLAELLRNYINRQIGRKALEASEERFRNLFQSIPNVAVQGYNSEGIITYWNDASQNFYGYSAEEVVGHNLFDLLLPPALREDAKKIVRESVKSGTNIPPEEVVLVRKDGSEISVYTSHAIVRTNDREPELFCVDIDLSEMKKLERQLLRAQRMESIGTLAGGIAHDLNNLFSPIFMGVDLLRRDNTSEQDEGSTFTVFLAAESQFGAEREKNEVSDHLPRGNGETILVADDEASILAMTQQTLEFYGYKVVCAHDGAEAIALFAQNRESIALVLTDIMMPVMDGEILVESLRRIDPDIPILVATGLREETKRVNWPKLGINHFLEKPFSVKTLLQTIHSELQGI